MCAKFDCGPTVVSKRGGYRQTDRQTDTAALYDTSWLPGFARDPPSPPSPPALPFVPPFCLPSLGLPGFGQNIWSVIAQNNSIPEIHFKKMILFSRHFMPFPDFYFFYPLQFPLRPPWGGEVNLFRFETIPSYIRMCVESWIYRQNITDIAKQLNMCVDL